LYNDDDEYDLLPAITRLLELGCGDPMARSQWGRTALHVLVRNDANCELNPCIDTLLSFVDESERTSYVNAMDAEGKAAIFYASAQHFSLSRVMKLLDLYADPLVGNPTVSTILHHLLSNVEDGVNDNDDDNDNGDGNGDDDSDEESRPDTEGDTLLAVTKLLELGCDPKAKGHRGRTALHILAMRRLPYTVDLLETLLSHVDESERIDFVNTADADGKSAIYLAAWSCSLASIINKMLDSMADPFVGDPTGSFILHKLLGRLDAANEEDTVRAVTKLLELGCDPKAQNERGQTALHILTKSSPMYDFNRIVPVLISFVEESERKSYVNARDKDGKSAVLYLPDLRALPPGTITRRVSVLLEAGLDIDATDNDGRTILHAAVASYGTSCSLEVITFLLECGADVNQQDTTGQTVLHLLISRTLDDERTKSKILSLFLRRGVRATMTDNNGNLPFSHLGDHNGYNPTLAFQLFRCMVMEG